MTPLGKLSKFSGVEFFQVVLVTSPDVVAQRKDGALAYHRVGAPWHARYRADGSGGLARPTDSPSRSGLRHSSFHSSKRSQWGHVARMAEPVGLGGSRKRIPAAEGRYFEIREIAVLSDS
jgi:hypothetical protein